MEPNSRAAAYCGTLRPLRPLRPQLNHSTSLTAEALSKALGGQRAGRGYIARCPAHDDGTPSLSIADGEDGRILIYCFAGCSYREVTTALRLRGLWHTEGRAYLSRPATRRPQPRQYHRDPQAVAEALRTWNAASAPEGTLVERYLRQERGLTLQPGYHLRSHTNLRHKSGAYFPGMVALVTDCLSGQPIGIHRTFLTATGEKTTLDPSRMMRGDCRGGVVRLGPPSATVVIGEGIETTLSGMVESDHTGWAALSASNLANVRLPTTVTEVILLADGDDPGREGIDAAVRNLTRPGRVVRRLNAPDGYDFNDILLGRASLPSSSN